MEIWVFPSTTLANLCEKKNMGVHQLLQQTYAMIYEKIDDRCGNIMGIMPLVLLDNLQYERRKFDW